MFKLLLILVKLLLFLGLLRELTATYKINLCNMVYKILTNLILMSNQRYKHSTKFTKYTNFYNLRNLHIYIRKIITTCKISGINLWLKCGNLQSNLYLRITCFLLSVSTYNSKCLSLIHVNNYLYIFSNVPNTYY